MNKNSIFNFIFKETSLFKTIANKEINSTCANDVLVSWSILSFLRCQLNCVKNDKCLYAILNQNTCKLYNENASLCLSEKKDSIIYQK